MDEPLAALDAARKQELLPYISKLKDILNIPIIYVSHQIQEIMNLADTLVLLENGKVLEQGPVDKIINNPKMTPYFGENLKSSFIKCIIENNDRNTSVTKLGFDGGLITTTILNKPVGSHVRVRIRAQDIAVSIKQPQDISIANIFEVKIKTIEPSEEGFVDLSLIVKNTIFWARLTKTSVTTLKLTPGGVVYALFKSTAIEVLGH
jgi:molybdate transport system ATP-binding protein